MRSWSGLAGEARPEEDKSLQNFDLDLDANTDDGSCIPVIEGCTDLQAYNFDSSANTDNDTCLYEGCTDNLYLEYYSQGFVANIDNGIFFLEAMYSHSLSNSVHQAE